MNANTENLILFDAAIEDHVVTYIIQIRFHCNLLTYHIHLVINCVDEDDGDDDSYHYDGQRKTKSKRKRKINASIALFKVFARKKVSPE